MKTGIVLMTALVPTIGHQNLIDFAANFTDKLYVIISTRSFEPTTYEDRVNSFDEYQDVIFINHHDDNAPQNPQCDEDIEFWNYWKTTINSLTNSKIDYVFSSEMYGNKLAEVLEAEHISFDTNRELYVVKGTSVRQDIFKNQHLISPFFIENNNIDVIFFGQESCGKTTMSKRFANEYNGRWIPEYARQYLETCGVELNEQKMNNIAKGQFHIQYMTKDENCFVYSFDTDLLSTVGYYRLLGLKDFDVKNLHYQYMRYYNNQRFYFVMNDEIPFEVDPLRYGGDKRETTKQYWIDILEEFGHKYHIVKSTNKEEQFNEIKEVFECIYTLPKKLKDFVRD